MLLMDEQQHTAAAYSMLLMDEQQHTADEHSH